MNKISYFFLGLLLCSGLLVVAASVVPTGLSEAVVRETAGRENDEHKSIGFVNAQVSSRRNQVQYMGRTTTAYTGDLDGLTGANAKCNAKYAGSHMCTQGEFLRSGTTSGDGTYGWIACEFVYGAFGDACQLITQSPGHTSHASCTQWNFGSSANRGPSMRASDANVLDRTCDSSLTIHCCKGGK
jgi:hypothetical protein